MLLASNYALVSPSLVGIVEKNAYLEMFRLIYLINSQVQGIYEENSTLFVNWLWAAIRNSYNCYQNVI